jgi:hypothetical protein
MAVKRPLLVIALGLFLLAAGLRFFRLGDWSFHGDELAMLTEIDSFATPHDGPLNDQTDRLPRLIPLSYGVQWFGCEVFGRREWGSRAITALLGSLHVVVIFIGLRGPLGLLPALVTALLTAVWPEHLYRSQETRFYMTAAFCSSLCMVAGAQAVARRSFLWTIAACLAGLATVFAHTLQAAALPVLFAAIGAAAWSARERQWDGRLLRLLPVVAVAGIVLLGVAVWHVLPLARGWNGGQTWGYSIAHAGMAAVSQLGWPVALLAALGLVGIWKSGGEQGHYWAVWALAWAASSVILPCLVSYHPGYVFPLSLGALVLAGRAVAEIYEGLHRQNALAGPAWLALACLLNLPSLVSHYADGSRYDFRTAAQYVGSHWQVGDRVAGCSATLLKHYSNPGIEPAPIRISHQIEDLECLARRPDRLWIVVPSGREGKDAELTKWLGQHCSQQLLVRRQRYDYYDNVMEVFLYAPEAGRRIDGFAATKTKVASGE